MRVCVLLLPLLLCACQDGQARQQNAELTKRVEALEAEVKALQAARPNAPTVTAVDDATIKAAAQNCGVDLARTMETFKQNSIDHRYPSAEQLELPDSCVDQHIRWLARTSRVYTFSVEGKGGQELARQSGP